MFHLGLFKMIVGNENDNLGLSLSLAFPQNHPDVASSSSGFCSDFQKPFWNQTYFPSSDNLDPFRVDERSFVRGIDVNLPPSTAECEEEPGVSSPNSTVSSVSGKRNEREADEEELDHDRACSRGNSDEEDGEASRKKLRLCKDQSAILEKSFQEHQTLNPKQKLALAKQLGLRPRQVEVWFQNRRARTKLKQTEVDCEYLKRCCENLMEENRRLQKEMVELRALKLSPQLYMQMTPPTTLTMCPSCERIGAYNHPAQAQPSAIHVSPWAVSGPMTLQRMIHPKS